MASCSDGAARGTALFTCAVSASAASTARSAVFDDDIVACAGIRAAVMGKASSLQLSLEAQPTSDLRFVVFFGYTALLM